MTAAELATEVGRGGASERRPGRRPPAWALYVLGTLPLALGGLVDVPRTRAVGPMTGLGALTVAESAVAGVVLLACAHYPRRLLARLAPFAVFLGWAVASVAWATPDVRGMQNLVAYVLLGLAAASAGALAARGRTRAERALEVAVWTLDAVALGLVVASLRRQGWVIENDQSRWLVHPRAISLAGLAPLAWHLARWYYGRLWDLAPAALWVVAIFVSLSRMATVTALLLVAAVVVLHYRARPRAAALPRLVLPGLGVALAFAAVLTVGPFRQRVFRGEAGRPDAPLAFDDAEINSSDRPLFWAHVARSALESPVVGKGIGSSQAVMNDRWSGVGHPHNDYLRVWHDLGLVGLALFAASFAVWARALAVGWRRADGERYYGDYPDDDGGGGSGQLQLAGLLALAGLALPMVTDNAVIYPFVVGPVGVLVGAGLGAGARLAPRRRVPLGSGGRPAAGLDARWSWEVRYPIRRRRRRA